MAAKALLNELRSENVDVRMAAVEKLAGTGPDKREDLFSVILQDEIVDVRKKAAELIALCPAVYAQFLGDIDPGVQQIVIDKSKEVANVVGPIEVLKALEGFQSSDPDLRASVAHVLAQHVPEQPSQENQTFVKENLCGGIGIWINDSDDVVKLAAADTIRTIAVYYGLDFVLTNLRGQIEKMIEDQQWRVRNRAIELILATAQTCKLKFFNHRIFPFIPFFLRDDSDKVRNYVISLLPGIACKFSSFARKLTETLADMSDSKDYTERQTYMQVLSTMADFFSKEEQSDIVFSYLVQALQDPDHGVVILALEILTRHRRLIHPFKVTYELKPLVEKLTTNCSPTIKMRAVRLYEMCK